MLKTTLVSIAIILTTFFALSCVDEQNSDKVILTEDVLYISGEKVRLSGRVYENSNTTISEHGFEISEQEEFVPVVSIDLGERDKKGQFIGEIAELVVNTDYWYRAYMIIEGEIIYGTIKQFKTLTVSVGSFSPQFAYPGKEISIVGANFSSNTRVFFGTEEAQITSIELESIINVIAPQITESPVVSITVEVGDESSTFEDKFQYIYGTWSERTDFVDDNRFFESLSMQINDQYILGLGKSFDALTLNRKVYHYDMISENWSELDFNGSVTTYPFQNSGGYFGGGAMEWSFQNGPTMVNEFWHFADGQFENLGELPFELYQAVSFYHENMVYVIGGLTVENTRNYNVFKYDIISKNWQIANTITFDIDSTLPHFTYGGKGYFITSGGEIHVYDFGTNIADFLGFFPSTTTKAKGVNAVIDGKAYIGLFSSDKRIWEFDIANNSWKDKTEFPGYLLDKTSGYYINDDKLHVIRMNRDSNGEAMKIWEFDPKKFN